MNQLIINQRSPNRWGVKMKHGRAAVVIGMIWLMCAMPALQPIAVYAESVQDSSVPSAQESAGQTSQSGDADAGAVGSDADQAGVGDVSAGRF